MKQELDALEELEAVPGPERSFEVVAAERLVARDAAELTGLGLDELLAG